MNTEKKKLWINALRSKKYKQGTGCLNKYDRLCCLGVLCELAIECGCGISKIKDQFGRFVYNGEPCVLPDSVIQWCGIYDNFSMRAFNEYHLIKMNDSGKTFAEIADYIDKNL